MEHGQRLRENPKIGSLLREVGERLMIAEREIEAVPIKKRDSSDDRASQGSSQKDGVLKEAGGDEDGEGGIRPSTGVAERISMVLKNVTSRGLSINPSGFIYEFCGTVSVRDRLAGECVNADVSRWRISKGLVFTVVA